MNFVNSTKIKALANLERLTAIWKNVYSIFVARRRVFTRPRSFATDASSTRADQCPLLLR